MFLFSVSFQIVKIGAKATEEEGQQQQQQHYIEKSWNFGRWDFFSAQLENLNH
jgi:hypothetical protein